MKTRISSKGEITLPVAIRHQDEILRGQEFQIERLGRGDYRLVRVKRQPTEGLVDLLLACPVKSWMKPLDRSYTTADIYNAKLD